MSTRERVMKTHQRRWIMPYHTNAPTAESASTNFRRIPQAVLRGFPLPVTEAGAPAGMCGRCRHSGQNKPIFIR
jgi:hypothetical protein